MPLKSDYNHIICIMEGETKNIRFVLKIYRFVLRLLNISFCGLYTWRPGIQHILMEIKTCPAIMRNTHQTLIT